MDMRPTIIPRSDQLNAEDFLTGPRTYTIDKVVRGKADQPFDFILIESPGKVYRPNMTERKIIVLAWEEETDNYAGRRLTLFRNPDVKWAGAKVGGIQVAALSHIEKPFTVALTETRGKRVPRTIEVLAAAPEPRPAPTAGDVAACTDVDTLRAMWPAASPEVRDLISARKAKLEAVDQPLIPSGGAS